MIRHFKKATIKDVAAQASVSTTTVSLYVAGRTHVCSPDTGKRIEKAVRALSYTPSSLTRGLRQWNSRTIGVCLMSPLDPNIRSGLFYVEKLWRGIILQADVESYSLLRYPQSVREGNERGPYLDGRVDGMITHEHTNSKSLGLASAGMPLILLMRSRDIPVGCGCVHVDESVTTDLAMQHLWDLGHRRIGYVAGPAGQITDTEAKEWYKSEDVAVARLEGYFRWMEMRGCYDTCMVVTSREWETPKADNLLSHFMAMPEPPTAIYCANDALAIAIIRAVRNRGLRVPEDLSVVGVDNSPQSQQDEALLTTVEIDIEKIGRGSIGALLNLMKGEDLRRYRLSLPASRLIVRRTTTIPGA